MDYKVFMELYNDAKKCDDICEFISRHGWEDWMNDFCEYDYESDRDIDRVIYILTEIFYQAQRDLKDYCEMSSEEFKDTYKVPIDLFSDTISHNINSCLDHLISYTILMQKIIRFQDNTSLYSAI